MSFMSHNIFFLLSYTPHNPSQSPIDSGATSHMACSVTLLTSIYCQVNSIVQLLNGESVPITYKGTILLTEHLILTDVLVVPSFVFNLISTSKLTKTIKYGKIIVYLLKIDSIFQFEHQSFNFCNPLPQSSIFFSNSINIIPKFLYYPYIFFNK
jgi:hypothetical protein